MRWVHEKKLLKARCTYRVFPLVEGKDGKEPDWGRCRVLTGLQARRGWLEGCFAATMVEKPRPES